MYHLLGKISREGYTHAFLSALAGQGNRLLPHAAEKEEPMAEGKELDPDGGYPRR